jgi:hypothetical protein
MVEEQRQVPERTRFLAFNRRAGTFVVIAAVAKKSCACEGERRVTHPTSNETGP